jgi:hypothetical protein
LRCSYGGFNNTDGATPTYHTGMIFNHTFG